jgi:hypothetical protein
MRSNSGRDEGRNNMHDPTIRDRSMRPDVKKGTLHGRSTKMGSKARKKGQKGEGSHR